jgi:hypothetical protein
LPAIPSIAGRLEALLRLFERCLAAAGRRWSVERAAGQAWQKGHHPKVYVLRRRDETGGTGD